jgi:hypothetical protein
LTAGLVNRHDPAVATDARLASIEAAVDEDAGEPDFERPGIAIRGDVSERLDECILNGLLEKMPVLNSNYGSLNKIE